MAFFLQISVNKILLKAHMNNVFTLYNILYNVNNEVPAIQNTVKNRSPKV